MEIKAKLKYLKISPRKVRLVVDVIRGMEVVKALEQLQFINKRAARPVAKLINSAVANAEHNFELEKNNLYIKEIKVDEGATLHRWKPRARGRDASCCQHWTPGQFADHLDSSRHRQTGSQRSIRLHAHACRRDFVGGCCGWSHRHSLLRIQPH